MPVTTRVLTRSQARAAGFHPSIADNYDAPAPPPTPASYRHIQCDESEVDRLWENGGGFSSFADYVRTAARHQRGLDLDADSRARYDRWASASTVYRTWLAAQDYPSVRRAVSSPDGLYELSDPDGGAVIPPHFIARVWDKVRELETPLSRALTVMTPVPTGMMPAIAETSRANGSRWGGLTSYWENEGQQLVDTNGLLQSPRFRCKKLNILIPASAELLEDSALLQPYLDETVHKEMSFQINEGMLNGNGSGHLLGALNSSALLTVNKDSGQASGTFTSGNASNMWARLHGPSRRNAIWTSQEDIDPDVIGGSTVATPTAWGAEQEYAHVKGRPWVPSEHAKAVGTPGDVVLADWSQYLLILMAVRKTVSVHFKFDAHEAWFRFVFRADGMPLWSQPLTPVYSTITKSAFVVTQQR